MQESYNKQKPFFVAHCLLWPLSSNLFITTEHVASTLQGRLFCNTPLSEARGLSVDSISTTRTWLVNRAKPNKAEICSTSPLAQLPFVPVRTPDTSGMQPTSVECALAQTTHDCKEHAAL